VITNILYHYIEVITSQTRTYATVLLESNSNMPNTKPHNLQFSLKYQD